MPRSILGAKTEIVARIDNIYHTIIIDDVSVKLPKSVSNFLFSGFRIIGRAPAVRLRVSAYIVLVALGTGTPMCVYSA